MTKSILITGASSGIGATTARMFLKEGWRVGLLARRREALEEVAKGHEMAVPLVGDVTDAASLEAAFNSFIGTAGRLDVLFNNAGIFTPAAPIDEIPLSDWEQAVAVNLTGMFMAARLAFGQMRRQDPAGGRIINNGSISAYVPRPGSVCYTATKHAITGLTKALSLDGRDLGIACGQIDIGNANTPMIQALNDRIEMETPGAPLNPTMPVEDAARAVLHMAGLPLEANVQFMTIMATQMPYIGRG